MADFTPKSQGPGREAILIRERPDGTEPPPFIEEGWSFATVPIAAVMGPHAVHNTALSVLVYLIWRSGPDHSVAFPGIRRMMEDLAVSDGTIRNAIHDLEEQGWVTVIERYREDGSQSSNAYRLHNPALESSPLPESAPPPPTDLSPSSTQFESMKDKQYKDKVADASSPAFEDFSRQPSVDGLPDRRGQDEVKKSTEKIPLNLEEWLQFVKEPLPSGKRNPVARLMTMFVTLFPDVERPEFSRLGKVARQVGGPGRLAVMLWQAAGYRVVGDPLSYVQAMAGRERRKKPDRVGGDLTRPPEYYADIDVITAEGWKPGGGS